MSKSLNEIADRLLAEIPATYDKTEGSFFYDAIMPVALEMSEAYAQVADNLQLGFAQTTSGQYLDYRADEHGINRRAAVKATGQIIITGTPGTVIATGSLLATSAGIQFITTENATVAESGSVTAGIEAMAAGAAGNVPANAINTMPVTISGITAVTNANPATGGTDTESDAELLTRLLLRVRNPPTSGNSNHYRQWAFEVAGVSDVKVFPIWNGNGTVKVVIIDSNKGPATTGLVDDVAAHIEAERPIGAAVTVVSAAGVDINVAANLTLKSGYTIETVQPGLESAIANYLKSIAFVRDSVSYAIIGSLILDVDGVQDYTAYTLNGEVTNIPITAEQVAVLGTVTLT